MINGALHLLLAISYVHDVNFLNSHSPLNFEQLHLTKRINNYIIVSITIKDFVVL
jgi:hypothetical protein